MASAFLLCAIGSVAAEAQPPAGRAGDRMVELDGRPVRARVLGLDQRRAGVPVVVFEAGATNSLEVWGNIPEQVAAWAPVVAYDRAGLGRSEWDSLTPTPRHVADRLYRLLRQVGAAPPYVLVGYSWGGILARYFAGYHPDDVAGLVLVDPGPIVTSRWPSGTRRSIPWEPVAPATTRSGRGSPRSSSGRRPPSARSSRSSAD